MVDFFIISTRSTKKGLVEIYPKFIVKKSSDLMIRGGDFYAIWLEDQNVWSTEEQDALQLIDRELDNYYEANNFEELNAYGNYSESDIDEIKKIKHVNKVSGMLTLSNLANIKDIKRFDRR